MSARRRTTPRTGPHAGPTTATPTAPRPDGRPPPEAPPQTPDPEDRLLTIREMCAAFDVTPRTLRFYEQKGLIAPQRRGQHRLYARRERARLTLILRGRRFGFALDQIGELLDLYDRDDGAGVQLRRTYAIARDRLADMERQRAELDEAIAELRAELARGADALARAGQDATDRPGDADPGPATGPATGPANGPAGRPSSPTPARPPSQPTPRTADRRAPGNGAGAPAQDAAPGSAPGSVHPDRTPSARSPDTPPAPPPHPGRGGRR